MNYMYLFLFALMTGATYAFEKPTPNRGETADSFLIRYAQWTETIPEGDQAWSEMEAVSEQIVNAFSISENSSPHSNFEADGWSQDIKIVCENPEIINGIHRIAEREYLGLPADLMRRTSALDQNKILLPTNILLPHLGMFRGCVKLLAAESALAAGDGDIDRALTSLESIRSMQRLIPVTNAMIEGLVEIACSTVGTDLISYKKIDLLDLDERQLSRLEQIYVLSPLEFSRRELIENEQWASEELLRSVYQGSRGGRITLRGTQRLISVMEVLYGEDYTQHLHGQAHEIRKIIQRQPAQEKVLEQYWAALKNDLRQNPDHLVSFRSDEYLSSFRIEELEYAPAVLLLISPRRWYTRMVHYQANQRALSLLIALHKQRLATGSFPSSMDEVDHNLLVENPIDPYTGQHLQFRVQEGNIVIYSVGPDRDDDGGRSMLDEDGESDYYPNFMTLDDVSTANPASIDGDWILYPLVAN